MQYRQAAGKYVDLKNQFIIAFSFIWFYLLFFFKDATSWLARFRQMNDITEIKSYVCEGEHDKHICIYTCYTNVRM